MGLKLYEFEGKRYKAPNKEALIHRLFKSATTRYGNEGVQHMDKIRKQIKKVKQGV